MKNLLLLAVLLAGLSLPTAEASARWWRSGYWGYPGYYGRTYSYNYGYRPYVRPYYNYGYGYRPYSYYGYRPYYRSYYYPRVGAYYNGPSVRWYW